MYFITCFQQYVKNENGLVDIGAYRTFGYYPYRDMAIEDLNENNCDIQERFYDYAVVEKIPMGLYPIAEERTFFKWDEEKQGFFEVDGAEFQDCFGNYALG